MRILAAGGGSGGHVTPVVAVLRELRLLKPKAQISFWCDRKFTVNARAIIGKFDDSIKVHTIISGKFRRFHGVSILQHLLWPTLVLNNFIDIFKVITGLFQSIIKLILWRPDVVFLKGGFVCLPVGVAAKLLAIPIVIHDSDAHPGLTNKIISSFATSIATGAPLENYKYPLNRSKYVGIPIGPEFHEFSADEQKKARKRWGIVGSDPLIVITGGGLGAKFINDSVVSVLPDLLKIGSIVLISGERQYEEIRLSTSKYDKNFQLHAFISQDIDKLLGAADVVVSRAGATFITELASLAKPTIIIPNDMLTGGHQTKNASVYSKEGAAEVLKEKDIKNNPQVLVSLIDDIVSNKEKAHKMSDSISKFARPNAARDVAEMIISSAN